MDHDHYRAAPREDDETVDNWVDKLEMLCSPKSAVGLIGSMYFVGVVTTLVFVPPLTDRFGRKLTFVITLISSVFA